MAAAHSGHTQHTGNNTALFVFFEMFVVFSYPIMGNTAIKSLISVAVVPTRDTTMQDDVHAGISDDGLRLVANS